ncbi:MAG: vitamin B12-dependent ribonucleotide reductase, partial [Candidatus Pacearchaeota archaeon]|nr:vitamin B12-dependent ribonucleotide reductase [Candidatus Pacearchaeota archaeon]
MDSFVKAVDLYITAQDIMVSRASYPSEEIARNSHIFRPLGLGYANLGAYIMSSGLAYNSDEARDFAAAITSLMTAEAYLQSTRLAEQLGTFQEFEKNRKPMLEVMEMHKSASKKIRARNGLEKILGLANEKWGQVIERGEKYGFRNAQVTLLAPTGTIGFMMGCDTTGCEPGTGLKTYKELSGGGHMVIINQAVPAALKRLGYLPKDIQKIVEHIDKNDTIEGCNILKKEHLPVFDCAFSAGTGERVISPMGHIQMLGAVQPFLSGAISKTINCPNNTSVEDIRDMFYQGWKLGIKALAIYRDGSKASQPLKTKKGSKLEILTRGEREHMPDLRPGITQKVKIGGIPLFVTTGEYADGRLGELFLNALERGSEINRLQNLVAVQFSEKLQYGVALREAAEVFAKAGLSQIVGATDHPFVVQVRGVEDFLSQWIAAHYMGDISFVSKNNPELRPLPWELRIYQRVPKLHLIPSVCGEGFYPGAPTLEETIEAISGMNYWCDKEEGLDTRQTIDKIKRTRAWGKAEFEEESSGKVTGRTCSNGHLMIMDGSCWKCLICKTSTGGCGGR